MKKGLKQKISSLLIMAMVITMSMPVSARENRSVFDDTPIIEDHSSDCIAIEEEPASDNLQASASDPVIIETERDAVGSDGDGGVALAWTIKKLVNGVYENASESSDYTYVASTNTVTILNNTENNTNGLVIFATTAGNEILNLTWADSDNNVVPVTLSADSQFTGVTNFTITTDRIINISEDAIVVESVTDNGTTTYSYVTRTLESGTFLVTHNTALLGDDVTVNISDVSLTVHNQTKPVLNVANKPAAVGVGKINYISATDTEPELIRGEGTGTSVILFGDSNSGITSMKTLSFETLVPNTTGGSENPIEELSITSIGSSYISGTISQRMAEATYEVATFIDSDYQEMTSTPTIINADGSFTITGLSSSTEYYVVTRVVGNAFDTRYQIFDGTLYIPSEWIRYVNNPVTTSSSAPSVTYTIMAKNGEETPTTAPASLTRVVFGGSVRESEIAQLILKRNGTVLDSNVTWSSDNAEAITVNSATGVIAIAEGAQAGAKATISASYNNSKVTSHQFTVKEEGGDVTICDQTGADITGIEALKNTNNSQFVVKYPASMDGHLALTAQIPENDTLISAVTAGEKVSTATSVSVPYTIATKYNTEDTTVTIHAEYTSTAGNTYTKDLKLSVNVKDRLLGFENVGTHKDEKTNTEYNFIKLGQSTTTITDTEGNATTIYPKVIDSLMPTEEYVFASGAPAVATIDENTGVITPVGTGAVTFTATSANGTMTTGVLNVVDDTPIVNTPATIHWDSPFTVTASFPKDCYTVSSIVLSGTDPGLPNGNIESTYDSATKKLTVKLLKTGLTEDILNSKTMNLTFTVKASSDITGETDFACQRVSKIVNIGSTSPSNHTVSEPKDSKAWNLFYTDEDIRLELPDGVDIANGTGKWIDFYVVEADGTVKVKDRADRKKAAVTGNSLIVLPVMGQDDSGAAIQIGEFQYQLPVFYQKPSLKLSSKSGTVNAKLNVDQTLSTIVLEKKSSGAYEALDISDQKEGVSLWTGTKGTVTADIGEEIGEVLLTTKDKANGKITIKLDNWSEKIELKYSVKATNKNVLTVDAKKVFMNVKAYNKNPDNLTVRVMINGREITEEDGVKVDFPLHWDTKKVGFEGVNDENILTGSDVTFCYSDQPPAKGNYNFTFKTTDGANVKVTLSVSNAALDSKAVSLKIQTKLDLVSGQQMVIIPTLKGIGGKITDVKFEEGSAGLFDVEYLGDLNQILASPVDISKLNAKDKYGTTVVLTVGGVECRAELKNFKVTANKPTVKISNVVVPKTKVIAGTAETTASVLSTVKQGGKTFTVDPVRIDFNGTKQDDGTWVISDSKKGSAIISYDPETSTIHVKSYANAVGKMPEIKAVLKYNCGVEVKKTISVKVDPKK